MKIEQRRSNFSQFSDSMWLKFECGNISGDFDLEQDELKDFALNMIDLAVNCLRKSKNDTKEVDEVLCQAIEILN